MGDKDSLSKFRPAKGRRSFRSRSMKQKSEDADDDRQVGGITILSNFSSSGCCNKYSARKLDKTNYGNIFTDDMYFPPCSTCLIFSLG